MILPSQIEIDASAHCQLACKACPTASGAVAAVLGAGFLDLAQFEDLLDRNQQLLEVDLSNNGEMFLHPRLVDIFRIARDRKVTLHADNGVNLNFAREEALEGLVRYGVRSLNCSIDGASQETYVQYRVNGNLERVLSNVRKINEYKRKHQSGFPFLSWQFVVFGHNQHEIGAARKLAGEFGMHFVTKLSWDDEVSPITKPALVRSEMPAAAVTRAEYHRTTGRHYMRQICRALWQAPALNWDGRVLGCCHNTWAEFGGNAFTDGLVTAVNGERISYAREMLMGRRPERSDVPCVACELYQTMKRDRTWITTEEVRGEASPTFCSIVVDAGRSAATHVDVFLAPGHAVDRMLLAQPPRATRLEVGRDFAASCWAPSVGAYTIYALPRRLDPSFRLPPVALKPTTDFIEVKDRPAAQEFRVEVPG